MTQKNQNKKVVLDTTELPNFIKLARENKQKFNHTVISKGIQVTANVLFLSKFGYL